MRPLISAGVLLAMVLSAVCVPSARAQPKEEVAILGLQSGKSLGKQLFLPDMVARNARGLRAGILVATDNKTSTEALSRQLLQAAQNNDKYLPEILPMPETEGMLYNDEIAKLAATHQKDVIFFVSAEDLGNKRWLLLRAYAGVQGKVLHSTKINAGEDSGTTQKEIEDFLAHPAISPAVNTLSPVNNELRLDTTPGDMHVYLGDRIVGLSPLIIRGLATEPTELKIFEQVPYQITKIKIISTPPGVEVFVNDEKQGTTPIEFPPELRGPGTYDIRFNSEDEYEAEIQIQTDPDAIPVQLNDSKIQRTPVSFQELDKTFYTLTLHPYRPVTVVKPVDPDTQRIHVNAYKYGKLILNTSVKDAEVELNNEIVGETPYSNNLPQGKHLLKVSKNRYRTREESLILEPGETRELFLELEPRSADTSIFLTPTGEITPQINIATKYLTFGRLESTFAEDPYVNEWAHLYGVEVDYGWPEIYRFSDNFTLGLEFSAAYFALQTATRFRQYPALGTKLQFLREGDSIPISAAVGGYVTLDPARINTVGYLSLSRNFGDFALHLGLQTHGFNLNFGYTGWDNIRLGALVYADSFFKLLGENAENTGTFYGLQAGYSF